ncbi:hypothetical protein [Acuticoccus mangrovi]|uniref:Oligosaccharide repeat unit polymerase n=1 Tax=Acuticoccus mangrovi TaxID=2796142 RepID=A0A934IQU5_9HYPH|nr:hypothetical protein [Acuticoccus mangrovi]MBJ3775929.1 hypothetical protein [Acuticoccus mangrovi]
MEPFAFVLLATSSLAVLCIGLLVRRSGYMQLPTLIGAVFTLWVVPQLWQIRQWVGAYEIGALLTLYAFCLLSLVAVLLGWRAGLQMGRGGAMPANLLSGREVERITVVITIVAAAMALAIGATDVDERMAHQWSGPLTILYFFGNLKVISLFLSISLFLKKKTHLTTALLAVNIGLYFPIIFIHFRRRGMLEAFTCAVLALWFVRRTLVPRFAIMCGLPLGMILVFAVGALRAAARQDEAGNVTLPSLSDILAIDFWSYTPFATRATTPELYNAFTLVRLANELGEHTLGAISWNRFVFQWVPAQIVGADVKNALMFPIDPAERILAAFDIPWRIGTMPTGMGEAYLEFGFLGALVFFAIALIMGRWWARAQRGGVGAATFYAAGLAPAVLTPAFYASYFFNMIVLYVGALVLIAAAVRTGRRAEPGRRQFILPRAPRGPDRS